MKDSVAMEWRSSVFPVCCVSPGGRKEPQSAGIPGTQRAGAVWDWILARALPYPAVEGRTEGGRKVIKEGSAEGEKEKRKKGGKKGQGKKKEKKERKGGRGCLWSCCLHLRGHHQKCPPRFPELIILFGASK